MALPTALLIKGLAGVGAIGSVVGGGLLIKKLLQPKEPNDIIKDLGIEDKSCHFTETNTTVTSTLDANKLKKVKFEKTGASFDSSASVSLTITKVTGVEAKDYTENLKFTLKNTQDTDITLGTNSDTITLKKDVGYDFKIKTVGSESKLEKAWTLETLGTKVGLTCANSTTNSCTLPTGKINVWKDPSNYVLEATLATSSGSSMTVTKDTKDYNQGFKFTVSADISLTQSDDSKKVGTVDKLTKEGKSYEIDLKDHNGIKTWFLIEKSTTPAA